MISACFAFGILASSGFQAPDKSPFPDTKANHWVYTALGRQGFNKFGWWANSDEVTTRDDVASAIVEAYGKLKRIPTGRSDAVRDLNARIADLNRGDAGELRSDFDALATTLLEICDAQTRHEEIADVERLSNTFAADLAARGVKAEEIQSNLSAADRRLFVDPKTAHILAPLQALFPNSKENHWAYAAISRLRADGWLISGPWPSLGNWTSSHLEFVLMIRAAYAKFNTLIDVLGAQIDQASLHVNELQKGNGLDEDKRKELNAKFSELLDEVAGIKLYDDDVKDIKRLINGFAPDFSILGLDVREMRHTLDTVGKRVSAITDRSKKLSGALKILK